MLYLYQYSCLLAVFGIVGFVGELSFLHKRNRDAEKECGHSNRPADKHIKAVQRRIHDPYAPPELYLAEIVRMATVFP